MSTLLVILGVLLLTAVPYILGCSNGAILVSKYILRDDIRTHGSGNAGLTNFNRVFGGKLTLLVILADVLKAVFGVLLGMLGARLMVRGGVDVVTPLRAKYIAGLFCELGHMFPCMFGSGRKGHYVRRHHRHYDLLEGRCSGMGSFLLLTAITKYVSVGSISTGILFPIMAWVLYRDPVCLFFAFCVGALIVFQHRGNIQRLMQGTENKFSLHKKAK